MAYAGFIEDGDKCPECRTGKVDWPPIEGCSCHINPPCSACTDRVLTCPECGWEDEPPEYVYLPAAPGLFIREDRPRPLDRNKISWRSKGHTSCTMIKEGVYPEGTTQEEVRAVVNGSFGGRFEQFGDGTFKFIAYTD